MTSNLDQMLEPGECVLQRAARFGWHPGWNSYHWIAIGLLGILAAVAAGSAFGLWWVGPGHILQLLWLYLVALTVLVVLEETHGTYSTEAIVTTQRIIAKTQTQQVSLEELSLTDVKNVELRHGILDGEYAVVSGRRGESFILLLPGGVRQLAVAIAAAAKLPQSSILSPLKQKFIKIYIWFFVVPVSIGLYLFFTYDIIQITFFDQSIVFPKDKIY